ncbi:NAD(P)H-binding protein [Lactobacillus porci]|uniref:NAD(P)H-binding protein n=1 Tax=Lactobacillus porci TaxID=2012477 RepID=UPI003994F5DB
MTKKVTIIGANGQIARLATERILQEQADVHLTLLLRNSARLSNLAGNPAVTIIDGDANHADVLKQAIAGSDLVYVSFVDHGINAELTRKIIETMDEIGVKRLISSNILGIYDEVKGAFGKFNRDFCFGGKVTENAPEVVSARAIEDSDLDYTILRIPWLNDRNEVKYAVTHKGEPYYGVSASRKSSADLIVKIIADPSLYSKESSGFADPATEGSARPVY